MEFEQVYDLYFRDVYRYILKLSGSEHVAEEITSDTFFKALRSIGKFRGSCDMRVWLCQIAKNCYYTYLRKEKHTGTGAIDHIVLWKLEKYGDGYWRVVEVV